MDPGLAGITAYVSQDCTGMKDEAAVDKNRILGTTPKLTLLFPPSLSLLLLGDYGAAKKGDRRLTVSIPQQLHPLQIYNVPLQPPLNPNNLGFDSCLSSQ